jgi:uncharacterized membrane protein YccF (DUF307 family)
VSTLDEQIDRKAREAGEAARDFVAQVDTVLSWVPEPLAHLVEPITRGLKLVVLGIDDVIGFCERTLDGCGDEDRLRAVGLEWVTRVGDVLGNVAGDLAPEKSRTSVKWTGDAAQAYRLAVPPQVAGLTAVKDIANQMRSSLNSLANSVESFKVAVLLTLTGFVVGAVGAIAGAITVVGAPVALASVTTSIGVALAAFGGALVAMNAHVAVVKTEQTTLQQKIHDLGGTWPAPNLGDLADASVVDGDLSDWRPGS